MATTTITLRGDWMQDGYRTNNRTPLRIAIEAGRAYDADHPGPRREARLHLQADGSLTAWGASVSFLPDGDPLDLLPAGAV